MMSHRDPTRMVNRIIFWLCLTVMLGFLYEGVYQIGRNHGVASVSCPAPKKLNYTMSTKALQRWAIYWRTER